MNTIILTKEEEATLHSWVGKLAMPSNPKLLEQLERLLHAIKQDLAALRDFDGTLAKECANVQSVASKISTKLELDSFDEAVEATLTEPTTKRMSYDITKITNLTQVQQLILRTLQEVGKPVSRQELANLTDLRLSTVCARVNELIADFAIEKVGRKKDANSGRTVETIAIRG